jgi:hypothetical protein
MLRQLQSAVNTCPQSELASRFLLAAAAEWAALPHINEPFEAPETMEVL